MWGLSGARDLNLGISAFTGALRTAVRTTKLAPCAFGNACMVQCCPSMLPRRVGRGIRADLHAPGRHLRHPDKQECK